MTSEDQITRTELLDPNVYSKYVIRSGREIRNILQGLINARVLLSAHVSPGHLHFVTAVIEFTDNAVIIDASPNETVNRAILTAKELVCTSHLEKIHIQFSLTDVTFIEYQNAPALKAPLPAELIRLQRREFYRMQTPITHPLICSITVPQGEDKDPITIETRVADISGGGLALIVPHSDIVFQPLTEFDNCRLHLADFGPVNIRLRVRNLFRLTNANGLEVLRAGCEFVDLPSSVENIIQRYIFKMERDRNARERGIN